MTPTDTSAESREWGSVRTKRGKFFVRFRAEGCRYERGPFSTWGAADKMRRRARSMIEGGAPTLEVLAACFGDLAGSSLTFRDAVPLYLKHAASRKKDSTLTGDTSRLSIVTRASWAGKVLSRVTAGDLTAWLEERRRRGSLHHKPSAAKVRVLSPASLNRDLTIVSAVYRWAKRLGYVESNPARDVEAFDERGRASETYLTKDEARALVEACSATVRPVILAALHTGMRRGELLALRWRSVDLDRRVLTIEAATEKAGRGRVVPLTEDLRLSLAALKDARKVRAIDGSDPVFVQVAEGDKREPLAVGTLRCGFATAVAGTVARLAPKAETDEDRRRVETWLAKRDRVRFHDCRHTAASLMVAGGVPLFDVAKILGHSTLAVTMRYAHFAPEAARSAVDVLGAALSTPTPAKVAARA